MAVTGRIAEIQQQFQRLAPPAGPVSPDPAFGRLLQRSGQALAGGRTDPHSVEAPAGLEGYGNGRIPEGALVTLEAAATGSGGPWRLAP